MVDEVFLERDVVRLTSGGGHAAYLGLDGTVYVFHYGDGRPPRVLDDPRDIASCIIRWATDIGLPELIDGLPAMLPGGETCSLCRGGRYMPEEWIGNNERRWFFCKRCGGLGWTLPTWGRATTRNQPRQGSAS
jgi:hypothetical protein